MIEPHSLPDGSQALVRWPRVAVVMPVLNEGRHLRAAVRAITVQDYPGQLEIVLALGPSDDDTAEIAAELAGADARISLVDNPSGLTPCGLNLAVAASTHEVVVRVDGHAILPRDYVRVAVEVLTESGADNVGGVMAAEGVTPFEQAVARAMCTRLGIGGSRFHLGGAAGPVETVYLGVFRREILDRVGGFDPTLRRAQDWELNHRIRKVGGVVWFTPRLHVTYRPRADLPALARQFYRTGQWRRGVIRRMPDTANSRYLAPPAVVLALLGGLALAATGKPVGWLAPAGYAVGLLGGAAVTGRDLPPAAAVRLPLVYATMHLAWGAGFLLSPKDLIPDLPSTP
ncbi:MAG TPA: glycosyltransferase family 2 protein [Sporichthyaceae bacterium]|nr:glycosyltransferase family 2 protein [Sporichthyaceae bacterium]